MTAPKSFREGIGHSLVVEMKKNVSEFAVTKMGPASKPINQMIDVFAQSGHPVFRGIMLSRGTLKRKIRTKHNSLDSGFRKH